MVTFDISQVSSDGEQLNLTCHIDSSLYPNYTITDISFCYYKYYSEASYSITPTVTISDDGQTATAVYTLTELVADEPENWPSEFSGEMFYAFVDVTDGTTTSTETSPIIDWKKIYESGINVANKVLSADSCVCDCKCGWADFVLRWAAFKLAAQAKDYDLLNEQWDMLFPKVDTMSSTGCNCG